MSIFFLRFENVCVNLHRIFQYMFHVVVLNFIWDGFISGINKSTILIKVCLLSYYILFKFKIVQFEFAPIRQK